MTPNIFYVCPECGAEWTEKEFHETLQNNEDWEVLVQSIGQCPDCCEVELA